MSIFKPIQENEASGKVKEIYEDIKNNFIIIKKYISKKYFFDAAGST